MKFTKITFTVTIDEAKNLVKAIKFFRAGCNHATAKTPKGIRKMSRDNMKTLDITMKELDNMLKFAVWINGEIEDLEADNEEFEKL